MNWFERHLNQAFIIYSCLGNIIGDVGLTLIEIGESEDWFVIGGLVVLVVGGMVSVGGSLWVLEQKGRSFWWVFLSGCFAPVWLSNKRDDEWIPVK